MQHTFLGLLVAAMALTATDMFADEQFLTAACSSANPARSRVVVTANGPGVQHREGSLENVVVYCQVHDDDVPNFYDWLQLVAEDNTPDGYAQATLWRMDTESRSPPEAWYSVRTSDQPGVQTAVNDTLYDSLDEQRYVYWIEVRLVRRTPDATVIVYNTALKDVF